MWAVRVGWRAAVLVLTIALLAVSGRPGSEAAAQPLNGYLVTGAGKGYVEIPHDPALNPTGAITIEAWVYPTSLGPCRSIVGKGYDTAYWLGVCSSNLRFYGRGSGSARDDGSIPVGSGAILPSRSTARGCGST